MKVADFGTGRIARGIHDGLSTEPATLLGVFSWFVVALSPLCHKLLSLRAHAPTLHLASCSVASTVQRAGPFTVADPPPPSSLMPQQRWHLIVVSLACCPRTYPRAMLALGFCATWHILIAVNCAAAGDDTRERTLSRGVGSLLWMAPEVLAGAKIRPHLASTLDVYSFGVVLWEIWARAVPWDEITESGAHFTDKLTELVTSGVRPKLPDHVPDGAIVAPRGYQELVEACWATKPEERPTFVAVLTQLAGLHPTVGQTAL